MTVPTFHYNRIVDLSRPLVPSEGQHPWVRFETQVDSIVSEPETAPASGRWYVVTQIGMSGHAGTHVEAPLHAVKNGAAVGELPVEQFFGDYTSVMYLGQCLLGVHASRKRHRKPGVFERVILFLSILVGIVVLKLKAGDRPIPRPMHSNG